MNRLPALSDVPPPPRRPSPLARKLIHGYQGSQRVMLIVGGGFLAMGLIFTLIMCWGMPVDLAIAASGRETAGTILSAERNMRLKINGRRPTKVMFTYEVEGNRQVGSANTFSISPGQTGPVEVEYASFNPRWSRLAGERNSMMGYAGLFVLLFPLIGALLLRWVMRANRAEIEAYTRGRPAMATVTFRGLDHSVSVNGRHPFMIRWEFRAADGGSYEGSLTSMKLLDIKEYGDAGEVVVLYDPENPKKNTLYIP